MNKAYSNSHTRLDVLRQIPQQIACINFVVFPTKSPTDRYWWTLTKSLSGIASREHFSVPSPANDHTLLKIIHLKQDSLRATGELNTDLEALFQFGQQWFMDFAPLKNKSLLISLKQDTLIISLYS